MYLNVHTSVCVSAAPWCRSKRSEGVRLHVGDTSQFWFSVAMFLLCAMWHLFAAGCLSSICINGEMDPSPVKHAHAHGHTQTYPSSLFAGLHTTSTFFWWRNRLLFGYWLFAVALCFLCPRPVYSLSVTDPHSQPAWETIRQQTPNKCLNVGVKSEFRVP